MEPLSSLLMRLDYLTRSFERPLFISFGIQVRSSLVFSPRLSQQGSGLIRFFPRRAVFGNNLVREGFGMVRVFGHDFLFGGGHAGFGLGFAPCEVSTGLASSHDEVKGLDR